MRHFTEPFLFFGKIKKNRLTIAIFIGIIAVLLMFPLAKANSSPGSTDDPVISKSYFDSLLNKIFGEKEEQLTQLERQLIEIEEAVALLESILVPDFPDIEGHWSYDNIAFLYRRGIIAGFDDGTFRPNGTVTRAQLATMIVRAKGLQLVNSGNEFTDLDKNHWAYENILAAKQDGFITGYDDGTFKPNNNVSRAEIASMLTRAFTIKREQELVAFPDVAASHWAKGAIDLMVQGGITSGYEDKTFRPSNHATRAEISAFLARVLQASN
ncbi:MAG: S-layer homology domain-containing protein [Bacillota bacterium]|nr:S-layer homology domain-containing protein [Bacillota bacterium]